MVKALRRIRPTNDGIAEPKQALWDKTQIHAISGAHVVSRLPSRFLQDLLAPIDINHGTLSPSPRCLECHVEPCTMLGRIRLGEVLLIQGA